MRKSGAWLWVKTAIMWWVTKWIVSDCLMTLDESVMIPVFLAPEGGGGICPYVPCRWYLGTSNSSERIFKLNRKMLREKDTCSNEDLKESTKVWDNFLLKFLCPSGNRFSRQIPSAVGENGWTIVYRRGTRTGSAYCWCFTALFPQQLVYINLHLFTCLIYFFRRERKNTKKVLCRTLREWYVLSNCSSNVSPTLWHLRITIA